jgi:transposase-like protein
VSTSQQTRREQWQQRISEQEKSGQSARAYCREHKVNEHAFYQWRQRLNAAPSGGPVRFALIEAVQTPAAHQLEPVVELILNSGERLRIPADASTLRLVLSVLREPVSAIA